MEKQTKLIKGVNQNGQEFEIYATDVTIEHLEEVKPKRVELSKYHNGTTTIYKKTNEEFTEQERNACEFMLNDLLPYGVKDEESLDDLVDVYYHYADDSVRKRCKDPETFSYWLKQSNQSCGQCNMLLDDRSCGHGILYDLKDSDGKDCERFEIKQKCDGCKRAEGTDSIYTCNCNVK